MNKHWSTYVQFSEELYSSRAARFRDDNADLWLSLLQIADGDSVLEVGCGSGIFCHQIKKHSPNTSVTGIDLDSGHIEFATNKAKELNLECKFLEADAIKLPFEDESFDVCFSYTVGSFCELNAFIKEQNRVLKKGGKCLIIFVINHDRRAEEWVPDDTCEEKELFDKIWAEANKNPISELKHYETNISNYFRCLELHNFKNIQAN